eukprot:scaffold1879_cov178-Amphora_coffeaeformis.AAC.5
MSSRSSRNVVGLDCHQQSTDSYSSAHRRRRCSSPDGRGWKLKFVEIAKKDTGSRNTNTTSILRPPPYLLGETTAATQNGVCRVSRNGTTSRPKHCIFSLDIKKNMARNIKFTPPVHLLVLDTI